ncbi:bacillithiol biosynthesis cysteine-adding enzyme BshC [Tenacibaculum sp. MAR_2009_124]|uniref:bacillithiol biosynthesis cysteine-adding enzyme BshC n=1 Tax=Tenacibaculum sp. MAR_2009_124 TaxID=1250059 RepID=UPI000896AC65|nr:bacillithiol biosynthesis cysteine-adding enzyme BshC [Tenacibaculum sp. MAR_2009_124]SEB36653.1 bacillithiol biosynthesis cysteine-adding enzyme BshC [Tenacibaculum sp. MAR_2009_124]
MKTYQIPFKSTGFFSKTMLHYLEQNSKIKSFYNNFPSLDGFKNQIVEKRNSYNSETRANLFSVLTEQYEKVNISEETQTNLSKLKEPNTFTVTTGHQLNLFTGPLYFLYKIISAINLCEELAIQFPEENFVPVYWMATEDHDFDEINYFNFKQEKIRWNSNQQGGVGRFKTEGLEEVFSVLSNHFGTSKNAVYLKNLFKQGYFEHSTLAEATRYIANELFGKYGLVIVEADNARLKRELIPFIKEELFDQTSYKTVLNASEELAQNYKVQVNPREINLFYLIDGLRERIVLEDTIYKVNNTDVSFSREEIEEELEKHPERFSPNVIMRPLYQEVILPNLCYIGGGGELAYWMQLKEFFNKVSVPYPILLLRNSVQVLTEKQERKLASLNVSIKELFLKQKDLLKLKVNENAEETVNFNEQRKFLEEQFVMLRGVAKKTDMSFIGAVNAQEKKQLKGLANLEKRLLRAEKRKQQDLVHRITTLQEEVLPNQSLEERQRNFSEYFIEYGDSFLDALKENLKPLDLEFTMLVMK